MLVRSPADLGAIIRDRRKALGLDQAGLAALAEVSRQWIVGVEQGRSRAELGLVLRTLDVLGLRLDARPGDDAPPSSRRRPDIDAIVSAARGGER